MKFLFSCSSRFPIRSLRSLDKGKKKLSENWYRVGVQVKLECNSIFVTIIFRARVEIAKQLEMKILHISIYSQHVRTYNRPIQQPAPGWHDSSTSRALHWHRRGLGFESRSGLNFSGLPRCCISSVTKKTRLGGSHTSNFQCFNYIVIKLVSICCRSLCLPYVTTTKF